jgi:predicted Zn-dependent protease with MMP-like domain
LIEITPNRIVKVSTMEQKRFVEIVANVLDRLPEEFRSRLRNLAILVEDEPPRQRRHRASKAHPPPHNPRRLLLGLFQGVPATRRSVFDLSLGPDRIVLYKKNIEAVCHDEAEIRHEIRQTVLHELGHYFGMTEAQLKHL